MYVHGRERIKQSKVHTACKSKKSYKYPCANLTTRYPARRHVHGEPVLGV